MNPAPESEDWLDAVQTRRVTPDAAERLRRQLASNPRELRRLEEELALNHALDDLPVPPVSSNFLSRVEARIAHADRAAERVNSGGWSWLRRFHGLRPLAMTAAAALVMGGWWQFRVHQRSSLATTVAAVSQAAVMPGVESLQDFDAVQLLRTTVQPGDVELLAALDTDPTASTP